MSSNIYFFEGECEEKLINCLRNRSLIHPGRLVKHNFWNEDISSKRRLITKTTRVLVVFDTDTVGNNQRFVKNVLLLARDSKQIVLLAQHADLEDELCFACNIPNVRALLRVFYTCRSKVEFKKRFIREKNLHNKLCNCGFDIDRLWTREDIFRQCLRNLSRPSIKIGQQYCR